MSEKASFPAPGSTGSEHQSSRIAELEAELSRLRVEVEENDALRKENEQARQAMLFMLEDLNESGASLEQAKKDWELTFDAVTDPIFVHDKDFRIVRANRAYARQANRDITDVVGRLYWQTFPLLDGPLPGCVRAQKKAVENGRVAAFEEEFGLPDGRIFRSHSYAVQGMGEEPHSIHLVQDITEVRRAAEALKASQESLKAALDGTIIAVTRVAEARDPYTSGHQRRVAALAAAIAEELGWGRQAVEGIHLGAMIHDIGKIHLPAEILSKPSRLNDIEFSLIKSHPQVGYDILKDIDFPWPVAEIAHQHHERLDGSGYPQGLKGDEICPEARIVSVADIVEAMASHRPYRAGLGIEAALKEVESQKGTLLDADAVDACLKIFREGSFHFNGGSSDG